MSVERKAPFVCPKCGGYAIASAFEQRESGAGRNLRRYLVEIDSQWCGTAGCKHNHDTGEPWGTGEDVKRPDPYRGALDP